MKLKCRINEIEYELVQGVTFSEEYNETLDSATIKITHEEYISMFPYDDVYIWDNKYQYVGFNEDKVYFKNGEEELVFTFDEKETFPYRYVGEEKEIIFFKHFLIDSFSETMLNVQDLVLRKGVGNYTPIYEYTIQLFSETKGLEAVQLPNISITEPLLYDKKIKISTYLENFINLYSPTYKLAKTKSKWDFELKYKISNQVKSIFDDVFSPDFTLNSPNLKDVIAKFFITKDMIPYVKNNIIYAMDVSERKQKLKYPEDFEHINYVSGSMSSDSFCDNLKKTYTNGLSQDSTSRYVENLGFRNSSNGLMTIENMRLETRFPIYKINKIYMCYYKEASVHRLDTYDKTIYLFVKQDITPLVKLNTERNLLSQDWESLQNDKLITSIEQMSKYKLFTVGYDIGSNFITGWGEKITYPNLDTLFWDYTKTYIENIAFQLNYLYPFGVFNKQIIEKKLGLKEGEYITQTHSGFMESVVTPFDGSTEFKGIVFQIDYQSFYNGTIVHTKDNGRDNVTKNDNQSSSLTLLEQDGLYTKEKANRFGNKGLTINARYDDISQLKELGSVYEDYNNTDVIIYHREYQIWDNYVKATYYGMHDYVLKNYFTNVYAKHRTWNLMSYSESVRRSENKKIMLLLSKNDCYYENINNEESFDTRGILFNKFDNGEINNILSFFKPWDKTSDALEFYNKKYYINYGYFKTNNKIIVSDVNTFTSGHSLCFNISMPDNISGGVYISDATPALKDDYLNQSTVITVNDGKITLNAKALLNFADTSTVKDDLTGSKQEWIDMSDDKTTGFINNMGIYVSHVDNYFLEKVDETINESEIKNNIYKKWFKLPQISEIKDKNIIGQEINIMKDNKEIIDMTYQIEPITTDPDILISPWVMRLSDLLDNYQKFDEEYENIGKDTQNDAELSVYYTNYTLPAGVGGVSANKPFIIMSMSKQLYGEMLSNVSEGSNVVLNTHIALEYHAELEDVYTAKKIKSYNITLLEIRKLDKNEMVVRVSESFTYNRGPGWDDETGTRTRNITFTKIEEGRSNPTYKYAAVFDADYELATGV